VFIFVSCLSITKSPSNSQNNFDLTVPCRGLGHSGKCSHIVNAVHSGKCSPSVVNTKHSGECLAAFGPGFDSWAMQTGIFCVEFACSTCVPAQSDIIKL